MSISFKVTLLVGVNAPNCELKSTSDLYRNIGWHEAETEVKPVRIGCQRIVKRNPHGYEGKAIITDGNGSGRNEGDACRIQHE
jgi:hypothetical protein